MSDEQQQPVTPDLQIGIEAIKLDDGYEIATKKLRELAEAGDPQSLMLYVQLRQLVNVENGLKMLVQQFNIFAMGFARMQKMSEKQFERANDPTEIVKQVMGMISAIGQMKESGLDLADPLGLTKKKE